MNRAEEQHIFEKTVKHTRFEMLALSSDIGQGVLMGYEQCQKDNTEKKDILDEVITYYNHIAQY